MKKKLLALLSVAMLVFVGFNNAACSDDDDDNNTTLDTLDIKTAAELGTTDGKAYAELYDEVKNGGVASLGSFEGLTNLTKMVRYGKKYKANQSKTYKASFVAAASGIGDATTVINMLENSSSVPALQGLLEEIFSKDE